MQSLDTGRRIVPALAVALGSTIAGGLVAAVGAHAPSEHASWASAYLVLVGGVATLGLALGRGLLSPDRSPDRATARRLALELGTWSVGNALVIGGTLGAVTWLVDLGGALLVVALALVVLGVRGGRGLGRVRALFAGLVALLLVSIPVGLVLARVRG